MKKKIMIVLGVVLVSGFLFLYKVFADYSANPASSVGLCYTEDWKATEFFVLKETNRQFSYVNAGSTDPRSLANPLSASAGAAYDFVPTKWEVTGSVSFKSEE